MIHMERKQISKNETIAKLGFSLNVQVEKQQNRSFEILNVMIPQNIFFKKKICHKLSLDVLSPYAPTSIIASITPQVLQQRAAMQHKSQLIFQ